MARVKTTSLKGDARATASKQALVAKQLASKTAPSRKPPSFILKTTIKKKPKTKAQPYRFFKVPYGKKGKVLRFRSKCAPRSGTICQAASAYVVTPKDVARYMAGPTVPKGMQLKALGYNPASFK